MELAELRRQVDALIAQDDGDDDPESAHLDEDRLMVAVLRAIAEGHPAPRELATEILRTAGREDTTRWYA